MATVKRMVNHSVGGDVTMKHYLRLSVEDLRESMQQVEDAFEVVRAGGVCLGTLSKASGSSSLAS